jgi:hypothetical protein
LLAASRACCLKVSTRATGIFIETDFPKAGSSRT